MSCQYTGDMKRNEVIQIRVSPEEKAQISQGASARRETVSDYIRKKAVLIPDGPPKPLTQGRKAEMADAVKDLGTKEAKLDRLITQLKGQGMTTPVARREAKKRLGL
jgi:hypothetical protein